MGIRIRQDGKIEGVPKKWRMRATQLLPKLVDDTCPKHGAVKLFIMFNEGGYNITEICLECMREIIQEFDKTKNP